MCYGIRYISWAYIVNLHLGCMCYGIRYIFWAYIVNLHLGCMCYGIRYISRAYIVNLPYVVCIMVLGIFSGPT